MSKGQLIGLDFGLKRIGIATGNRQTGLTSALTTLPATQGEPDYAQLKKILDEWRPEALVVGIPVHMDGTPMPLTKRAQKFSKQLGSRFDLPVYPADERLSSRAAEEILRTGRAAGNKRRQNKGAIDSIAAALILQHWLQENPYDPL